MSRFAQLLFLLVLFLMGCSSKPPTPTQAPVEPAPAVDAVEKPVVNLTHQDKFVGEMLDDVEVAGQSLAVVEGRSRILVIPSQPDLSAQKGKMVAVRTRVTPDNELIAEVGSVRRKRDKGMER